MKKPCKTCPFRTDSGRGCDHPKHLGHNTVEEFVGQTLGPFRIPCHAHIDYDDPDWHENARTNVPECVGNASLRKSIGADELLPPALLQLEEESSLAFNTLEEFIAHHKGVSLEAAAEWLTPPRVALLSITTMMKPGVKFQ